MQPYLNRLATGAWRVSANLTTQVDLSRHAALLMGAWPSNPHSPAASLVEYTVDVVPSEVRE